MASIQKRPDGAWRARYRDQAGKEHARHFKRRTDAQRWLDEVTADMLTGRYVDPRAGRITFRRYAEQWRRVQQHRPSTQDQVERHLRRHVYPVIGDRPLDSIVPSDIRALRKRWEQDLAPATAAVVFRYVASIFKAAVGDKKIPESPCTGFKHARPARRRVIPVPTEKVEELAGAFADRYKALVVFTAGTGVRQGEAFGLTLDRVDFLRREVLIDRQLVSAQGGVPTFGPTKNGETRVIPLPMVVVDALAAHLRDFPVGEHGLVFTNHAGHAIRRSTFNERWRRVCDLVGLEDLTFHGLRHYYASLLIHHGESVKVVQERLGHKSATETLDTYSHLWADSDDRTRQAVDSVLGARILADSVRTTAPSAVR